MLLISRLSAASCRVLGLGLLALSLRTAEAAATAPPTGARMLKIGAATGVPVTHMMMSATHTHRAVSARGKSAFVYGSPLDDYQTFLIQRIADGVRRALNNLEPARIGWGSGQAPQHVFNRRWLLKDGETAPNPFGGQDKAVMNPGAYLPTPEQNALGGYETWLGTNRVEVDASRKITAHLLDLFGQIRAARP